MSASSSPTPPVRRFTETSVSGIASTAVAANSRAVGGRVCVERPGPTFSTRAVIAVRFAVSSVTRVATPCATSDR